VSRLPRVLPIAPSLRTAVSRETYMQHVNRISEELRNKKTAESFVRVLTIQAHTKLVFPDYKGDLTEDEWTQIQRARERFRADDEIAEYLDIAAHTRILDEKRAPHLLTHDKELIREYIESESHHAKNTWGGKFMDYFNSMANAKIVSAKHMRITPEGLRFTAHDEEEASSDKPLPAAAEL
jgi:hypothetical protein